MEIKMFSWLFGKKKEKLFDHDIDTWNYLGYTNIMFTVNDKPKDTAIIHFFVHNNGLDRSWTLVSDDDYKFIKAHPYCTLSLPLWKARETNLERFIEYPSNFLHAYMLKNYDKVRDDNNEKWIKNIETEEEGNVIKVKFKGP